MKIDYSKQLFTCVKCQQATQPHRGHDELQLCQSCKIANLMENNLSIHFFLKPSEHHSYLTISFSNENIFFITKDGHIELVAKECIDDSEKMLQIVENVRNELTNL